MITSKMNNTKIAPVEVYKLLAATGAEAEVADA